MKSAITVVLLIFCLLTVSSTFAIAPEQLSPDGQQVPSISYKEHADKIETIFMWASGWLAFVFTAIGLVQGISAKTLREDIKETTDEIHRLSKKTKRNLFKSMENCKMELDSKVAENLSSVRQTLIATMDLNEARLRLTREITDLDEPSIHHPLPAEDEAAIKNFLAAVKTQQDTLDQAYGQFEKIPASFDIPARSIESIMDLRIVGKAKHYVGEYQEAIDAFKQEKNLIEQKIREVGNQNLHDTLKQDLCKAQLHLGQSYAGFRDYTQAIFWYEKIESYKTLRDLKVQVPLSKAHAYKEMEKFEEAKRECEEVRENSGLSTAKILVGQGKGSTRRCYWEAVYEQANSYTALGKYEYAAPLYKDAADIYKAALGHQEAMEDFEYAGALVWLHMSYGDCLFKWGPEHFEDAESQYRESLVIVDNEIELLDRKKFKGPLLYRLGRLHISKGKFRDAEELFCEIEDNNYIIEYEKDIFEIFYGYSLLHMDDGDNKKNKRGKDNIANAVKNMKNEVKNVKDNIKGPAYNYKVCDPSYHIAMGWAMQDEEHKTKAIELLEELTTPPYEFSVVKEWAKSADCADFPELELDPRFRKVVGLS